MPSTEDAEPPIPAMGTGDLLARVVFALGLAFAGVTLYLRHEVDQRRSAVSQRVNWMLELDETHDPAGVYDDITASPDVGDALRQAAEVATQAPAHKERVVRHLRRENGTISRELSGLWDLAEWVLTAAAAMVVAAGAGVIWGQSLRGRLGRLTRRHQAAELQSREQSQLLTALFEQGPFGVHIFDGAGRALYSAPNNTRRRGLLAPDFPAEGVTDIRTHHLAQAMGVVGGLEAALTGETVDMPAQRMTFPPAEGKPGPPQTLWLAPLFIPIRDDTGRVERMVALIRDETDKKVLTDRVRRAEHLAEVGTLAAGVAHEINNPLTFVAMNIGMVGEMLDEPSPPIDDIRELLTDVEHGVDRIRGVTADLSALALPHDERRGPIRLDHLLERVIHMVNTAEQQDATVQIETAIATVPPVLGTVGRLEQVFTNLLQNAIWACHPQQTGQLRVEVGRTSDERAWVEIHDNGVGISPEVATRIFEPFFTTRRGGRGTGLGLYLVRCYLEELGGSIECQSVLGEGTCMRVTLPLMEDDAEPSTETSLPGALQALVVAADPAFSHRIHGLMADASRVHAVSSPAEAVLEFAENDQWDVILTDQLHTAAATRQALPEAAVSRVRALDVPLDELERDHVVEAVAAVLARRER